jgi:hypothetical protein
MRNPGGLEPSVGGARLLLPGFLTPPFGQTVGLWRQVQAVPEEPKANRLRSSPTSKIDTAGRSFKALYKPVPMAYNAGTSLVRVQSQSGTYSRSVRPNWCGTQNWVAGERNVLERSPREGNTCQTRRKVTSNC